MLKRLNQCLTNKETEKHTFGNTVEMNVGEEFGADGEIIERS